jgi:hypothetical protein
MFQAIVLPLTWFGVMGRNKLCSKHDVARKGQHALNTLQWMNQMLKHLKCGN